MSQSLLASSSRREILTATMRGTTSAPGGGAEEACRLALAFSVAPDCCGDRRIAMGEPWM
jgi:hypothetical protein